MAATWISCLSMKTMTNRRPRFMRGLVRKLINWLTVKTGEGDLYEIDTALRPNGSSGLLITTFEAYANYQQQRGSNTAWTWEHQAMTRARFVLGSDDLRQRFDAVRHAVVCRRVMRKTCARKSRHARKGARGPSERDGQFDVKHSPGGMMDAEFAVQYLVSQARRTRNSLANVGNIALLQPPRRAACCRRASASPPPTPTASCAGPSTGPGWTRQPTQVAPEAMAAAARRGAGAVAAVFGRARRARRVAQAGLGLVRRGRLAGIRQCAGVRPAARGGRLATGPGWTQPTVARLQRRVRSLQRAPPGGQRGRLALVTALGVAARAPQRMALAWFAAWPLTQLGLLWRPDLAALWRAVGRRACRCGCRLRAPAVHRPSLAGWRDARGPARQGARRVALGRSATPPAGLGHRHRAVRARERAQSPEPLAPYLPRA